MGRRKKLVLEDEDEHPEVGMREDDDRDVVNPGGYEDDEDDDEEDEFEDDGFIVNDYEEDEEEEEDQNDGVTTQKQRKKRKRKSLKSFVLDEDDFELLRENATIFHQPNMETTKFKRLKQAGRDTNEVGVSSALFNDEGMHFEDDIGDEDENMSGSGDEEDEMADFIEDDEITVYENATPIRERKPKEKKKKKRQALGVRVTSSVLEGGHYLFGDVDELLQQRKQGQATSHKADDMDGFDPFIQTEKYMDEKDDPVHEIDIPERMQIYEGITGHDSVEELSLEEESSWILNRLATNMFPLFREKIVAEGIDESPDLVKEINKEDIVRFLKLHHVEKYDIPFIAMYRKEQCRSLLKDLKQEEAENEDTDVSEGTHRLKWHKVLWAIKELHRKWMLLQKRKSALLQYYYKHYEEFRNNPDKTMSTSSHQLFESVITSLRNAESERDIDDVDMKFSLHFPPVEAGVDEGLFRRPKRRSQYYDCIKAGLWKVARKFGCDSEQFGLQVTLKKVRMDMLEEPEVSPKEVALNFTCAMFETPEAVLKGARYMAALEISCEPFFRRHLHSIFLDKALVSTSPTPEGNKAIDSFHQFSKVKWLHEKPLVQFLDAQWLLIQKAEEEKLLQVTIKLPESTLNELKTHSHDCYLRDGLIESGRLWNEQCRFILEDAFSNYLLPSMEKEARNLLTARAKNWLLMEYGQQLWTRVSVAPYKCKENNVAAIDVEAAPRVMACCWGPGKPPTTFVMLDSMGEVLDVLHAGYLSSRSQNVIDQQRKKNDQHHLLKFLKNHQPHVVVLGAANSFATQLKDAISEIICQMEENPTDVEQATDGIPIVYGDVLLPHLYEHSQISSEQLPGKPGIVKQAVALGRYLQNPLAMIATLCDAGREIVNWKLSSLDHFLPSDEKYEMIEQVMVDVTNQVGLDINLALNHEWLYAPLQFISGLGSQKAASIKKAFIGAREVRNRMELTGCGLRTKNIFHNAVGFLRVHYSNLLAIGTDINILDDTRIHPESYCLAEELAKAVHKCYAQDDTDNDVFQELAIENLRANPNLLKGFDVTEYADDYEKEKGENRIETFYDIKAELRHGFQDPRKAYKEPTQDEEFHMISGGFRDMLAEGRIVQATVRRVLPQRAICVLEVGLTGILSKDDFSDQGDDFDLKDKLHEGASLACKIKQIEKSKYLVFLSCKESELKSNQNQDFHDADPYYREGWSSSLTLQDKPRKEKELTEKHFTPRTIFHPRFQNMTMNEAVEFLSDKDAGECIFRPSLRGAYYLTLTLKVYDGVYAHKDIFEDGKDQADLTSLLRLGRSLKIGDDKFRDLDEVMEQYVDPLVAHLKAMIGYRKFKRGAKAEVDDILRAEKTDYPMRITYYFCISHEHPGTFVLSYIRSTNPQHNYVGLHPKGFKFQKHTFKNIEQLVAYFQKNIDGLQKTPMAPMTGKSDNKDDFKGDQQSSGLPRPYGGGGGGRGSYSNKGDTSGMDKKDFGYGIKNWESNPKDGFEGDDGLSAGDFSVGMGSGGTGGSDAGNWGGGGSTECWGGSATAGQAGGCASGDNQGGRGGRGRGRGRERGRGRGSCGDRGDNNGNCTKDSNYSTSSGGSDFKSEDGGIKGWSSFTGTEIQNGTSGKWDSNGSGNAGNNNWGGGGNSAGGWCSNTEGKDAGGGFWDGSRGRGTDSGGRSERGRGRGRGNDFGRGNGRGRGRGRGYFGDDNGNDMKDSNYSTSSKWDSNGSGNAANGNWGGSGSNAGGWGSSGEGNDAGGGIWDGSRERGRGRGNDFGRGNGRGRGRGRGYFGDDNGNDMKDSNYSTSGKWDSNGSGNAANGNWGGSGSNAGGWGSSGEGNDAGGGIWDGSRGRGTASGGRSERGRGRGRGRDLGRGNGRGRGRGYGGDRVENNGNDRNEFNYSTSNCGSDFNDKGGGIKGWSSFDGTEVQNGPSGKWKSNGSGNAGNGNMGGGGSSAGGWNSSSEGKDAGGGIWDGGRGRGTASGGRSERGRGRGRGFGRNTGSWGNDRGADHASGGNWVGGGSGNASGSGWDSGAGGSGW